jgi:hypothetical protein
MVSQSSLSSTWPTRTRLGQALPQLRPGRRREPRRGRSGVRARDRGAAAAGARAPRSARRLAAQLKDTIMKVGGAGFVLFAKSQPDTPGKLTANAYSFEHLELASYELLLRAAERAGDAETAEVARRIRDRRRGWPSASSRTSTPRFAGGEGRRRARGVGRQVPDPSVHNRGPVDPAA